MPFTAHCAHWPGRPHMAGSFPSVGSGPTAMTAFYNFKLICLMIFLFFKYVIILMVPFGLLLCFGGGNVKRNSKKKCK